MRTTNVYVLKAPISVEDLLRSAQSADAIVTGSWVDGKLGVISYRVWGSDPAAIELAERMIGDTPGAKLYTGLGVHRRVVAES